MAFSSPHGDRSDEFRYRGPQSPRDESAGGFPSVTSPLRGSVAPGTMPPRTSSSSSDARAGLHRSFTMNNVPTLSPLAPIGQQRRQAAEPSDLTSATFHKVQLLEKKKLEYEFLREQRKRFQAEIDLLELQTRHEENEMDRLTSDLTRHNLSGHQSEPTTPPEYRDNHSGFPTPLSRPNRFSTSILSPSGFTNMSNVTNRNSRPQSSVTSPQHYRGHSHSQSISHVPSKSVPGSRRGSDEEEDSYDFDVPVMNKKTSAKLNRNSMPVSGHDFRSRGVDLPNSVLENSTTSFLFNDDEESHMQARKPSSDVRSYLQMNTTESNFPILVRRGGDGQSQLSASSAALDLALAQASEAEEHSMHAAQPGGQPNGWGSFSRHRSGFSLPMNSMNKPQEEDLDYPHSGGPSGVQTPTKSKTGSRRSMEVKFADMTTTTPPNGSMSGMPRLQSSYSTNDIPTMRSASSSFSTPMGTGAGTPTNTHAEQHLHKHNASLGRIPLGVTNNRHSRELTSEGRVDERPSFSPHNPRSGLQASAAPFGPPLTPSISSSDTTSNSTIASSMSSQQIPPYYNGYGMPMMNMQMNNNFTPPQAWGTPMATPPPPMYPNQYGAYNGMGFGHTGYQSPRIPDNQSRVMHQRRAQNGDDNASNRFANATVESLQGQIYTLSKDQHGCRFLQKKLEERNPTHIQMIFNETNEHVVELMTDPFGNYLCQKLLEYANEDQRTTLINNASTQMVKIALNQHGTRALQKMIEFITTPEQVQTINNALTGHVVMLIKDLNGNHVIQKCLNHLQSEDAQFIIDAVGENCVVVGTHRHGCCVIQRCIDHASVAQRPYLVGQITSNSFQLVQDPFGNYVVQYILDLGEPRFSTPLCLNFRGSIAPLSKQKFSSNVIEKCIRTAEPEIKRLLIEELLQPQEIEKLLRDSYANYVVQTAMDFSDPVTCHQLVEAIRPLLPTIRTTPYGRRIANKVADRDARLNGGRPNVGGGGVATMMPQETGSPPPGSVLPNGHVHGMVSPQYHHPMGPLSPPSGLSTSPPVNTPPRYRPNGTMPNGNMGNMF